MVVDPSVNTRRCQHCCDKKKGCFFDRRGTANKEKKKGKSRAVTANREDKAVEISTTSLSKHPQAGVFSTLTRALKRKQSDRSPEAGAPAASSSAKVNPGTIVLPPAKKASVSSLDHRSTGTPPSASPVDNRSVHSFRDESVAGSVLGRQGSYPSMAPPLSSTPSITSFSTSSSFAGSHSSDPNLEVQRLQVLLQSSQEDLRMANSLAQFHQDQYRQLRSRQDQERQEYRARIAELESRQSAPRGSDGRKGL